MEIQQKESAGQGLFFVMQEGKRVAALAYDKEDNSITIEHTEVDKSLRGQNIGQQLVEFAVQWARENNLKVSPICPFAKVLFDKNPEWKDVLA